MVDRCLNNTLLDIIAMGFVVWMLYESGGDVLWWYNHDCLYGSVLDNTKGWHKFGLHQSYIVTH